MNVVRRFSVTILPYLTASLVFMIPQQASAQACFICVNNKCASGAGNRFCSDTIVNNACVMGGARCRGAISSSTSKDGSIKFVQIKSCRSTTDRPVEG